jgi:hypothetical protein
MNEAEKYLHKVIETTGFSKEKEGFNLLKPQTYAQWLKEHWKAVAIGTAALATVGVAYSRDHLAGVMALLGVAVVLSLPYVDKNLGSPRIYLGDK